jgi:hypothetical protein
MSLGVDFRELAAAGLGESLGPVAELPVESIGVVLLELVHVGLNVLAEDVSLVLLRVERSLGLLGLLLHLLALLVGDNFGLFDVVAWESLLLVRNEEAAIASALHGTENSVTGGGSGKTDIEECLEWAALLEVLSVLHRVHVTVDLGLALIHGVHADVLEGQEATSGEEASAVGSSVVGVTGVDTEAGELARVGSDEGLITFDRGVDDLADDALVGPANDETVLLAVVLILLLDHEASASLVIGLAFTATAPLGLVAFAVSLVLQNFDECHFNE